MQKGPNPAAERLTALLSEAGVLVRNADLDDDDLEKAIGATGSLQALLMARHLDASMGWGRKQRDRLLTMPEVAERLAISEETARELGRRREVPTVNFGRCVRVRESALARYVDLKDHGALSRRTRA